MRFVAGVFLSYVSIIYLNDFGITSLIDLLALPNHWLISLFGLIGPIGHIGRNGLNGFIGLSGTNSLNGLNCLIGPVGLVSHLGLVGLTVINSLVSLILISLIGINSGPISIGIDGFVDSLATLTHWIINLIGLSDHWLCCFLVSAINVEAATISSMVLATHGIAATLTSAYKVANA
jgi:hypothetical protein